VEAVGTYRLILDIGFHLDLFDTFYVPSISKLDVVGYSFKFRNGCFNLYKCTCMGLVHFIMVKAYLLRLAWDFAYNHCPWISLVKV